MTQPSIDGVGHGVPRMLYASDGSNWYAILVDTLGHLQVDVVSAALGTGGATEATLLLIKGYVDALETLLAGGLPAALDSGALKVKEQSPLTGFATSANQATMITALQLIDDLRAALGSVNTDDLQVDVKTYPGSNVLGNFSFGYYDTLALAANGTATGTNITLTTTAVPVGEVWVITNIAARDGARQATVLDISVLAGGAADTPCNQAVPAGTSWIFSTLTNLVLKAGDQVRAILYGTQNGDACSLYTHGYKMKVA